MPVGYTSTLVIADRSVVLPLPRVGKYLGIAVVLLVGILALGQLVLSNSYVTKGGDLATLQAKKTALQEENDILKTRLANGTSLTNIASAAAQRGFVHAKNVVFLPQKDQVQPVALESSIAQP